ncbi:MAG: hypothetical protein NTY64_20200 [Deltaproteobacteria bacterium]|nr:hypothetical protein [Deltaproteobacteria bacterium]
MKDIKELPYATPEKQVHYGPFQENAGTSGIAPDKKSPAKGLKTRGGNVGHKGEEGKDGFDHDAWVVVPFALIFWESPFPAYLFYPLPGTDLIFRVNHRNKTVAIRIAAFLLIFLANFRPIVTGKRSIEVV